MRRELERMRASIAADRDVLARHLAKLTNLEVSAESSEERCALVALTMHQTYTALENVLKRIAAGLGKRSPATAGIATCWRR